MSERDHTTVADGENEITLGLLHAVHENSTLTQRTVAGQLGIALGLANAYLRRCVKKGLIKVKQVPPNRYAYYLTPKGFTEKSRLTAEYLSSSFNFFRKARRECFDLLERCKTRDWARVALCGTSDLGEVAALCARELEVELVGFIGRPGDAPGAERFAGLPIASSIIELGRVDAVIVTDLTSPQATFDDLRRVVPAERILTPNLLRVTRAAVE
ncbi:MAG: winged helix-turn-helix transcriptional regulator [Alphaproteobacteria bacterium]